MNRLAATYKLAFLTKAIFALVVGLFLLLLPFQVWQELFSVTQTAKVLFLGWGVVGFVAIGGVYYLFTGKPKELTFTKTDLFVGVLLLYAIIHPAWIKPARLHPLFVTQWLALAPLYIVFRRFKTPRKLILMLFVMVAAAAQAVYGNLQLYGIYPSYHNLFNLTESFFNSGPYSGYLASVVLLAFGIWLFAREERSKIAHQAQLSFANFSLHSKVKFVAIIAIFAIVLVLPARRSRAAWVAGLSSILHLFILNGKAWNLWPRLDNIRKKGVLYAAAAREMPWLLKKCDIYEKHFFSHSTYSNSLNKRHLIYLFLITVLNSCYDDPLNHVLKNAGENKAELIKVIDYYMKSDDNKKYQAARFLIENMPGHFSYDTCSLGIYRPILFTYDSLIKYKRNYDEEDLMKNLNSLWYKTNLSKSIYENIYHRQVLEDVNHISSSYLIENISQAFQAWEKNPYSDSISFKEFCEYILPYRRQQGFCLEEWRSSFYNKHFHLVKDLYPLPIQKLSDSILVGYSDFQNTFKIVPDYPYLKLCDYYISKRGTCYTKCWLNSMIFASLGIPVAIDYVPAWGNRNGKHYWNALVYNGRTIPFESYWEGEKWKYKKLYSNISCDSLNGNFRLPKVYRYSYISDSLGPVHNPNESLNNIPSFFLDTKKKDVSNEYFETCDVEIIINQEISDMRYAYICVFGPYNLIPVHWGLIDQNKVVFTNMGKDIVYTSAIYQDGLVIPVSQAFYLTNEGKIKFLEPSNQIETVKLTRKYPLYPYKNKWTKSLIGGKFQGANKADFDDAINLYKIEDNPGFIMQRIRTKNLSRFRYLRFLFPKGREGNLAEMKFFSTTGNKEIELTGNIISSEGSISEHMFRVLDGDLATYLPPDTSKQGIDINKPYWIGVDLSEPRLITDIGFCPRNDTNNIIVGNTYELCYWKKEWISLGIKQACSNELIYEAVPQNALLILKCLDGGVEERIFLYRDGEQIWL